VHKKEPIFRRRGILFLEVLVIFAIYTAILFVIRSHIPDAPLIIQKIKRIYGQYGYDLIFLGALLEGTFIVGFYVPGSFIILLGSALARTGVVSFPLVVLFGTLGLTLGYTINYFLGRYGWYRILAGFGFTKQLQTAQVKLLEYQDKALFLGYIMPSTGSFLSTAAGALKLPFKKFILKTLVVQAFWSLILGGLAYIFGMAFIQIFLQYFGFVVFVWVLLYFLKRLRKGEEKA